MRPIIPEPDLSERIHDSVLEAICSGELKSGARITQEELAQQFGVSRQPVLQAMMLLRREGFLGDLLTLAEACESSDDAAFHHAASTLHLSSAQINGAHLQALAWADHVTD